MGLPCFSSCYGLLSFLLVLLPIVTGIPIPLNSDLVRRYWEGSDLFTGDSLDFTSTQGSSDLSMSGADTNGSGDGPPMDWGLGDDPSVDWGLGDHPIKLEGGLGNDALNTDDGSFQLAASFNGDQSNNCQIRFRSGDCKNGQREFHWTWMAGHFYQTHHNLAQDTSVSSPAPQTPPTEQPGPELVPVPQDPEANCQIRLGCKADGEFFTSLYFVCKHVIFGVCTGSEND